jgi:hypothetical protein
MFGSMSTKTKTMGSFAPQPQTDSKHTDPNSAMYVHPYPQLQPDYQAYKDVEANGPMRGMAFDASSLPYHPEQVERDIQRTRRQHPGADLNNAQYWESNSDLNTAPRAPAPRALQTLQQRQIQKPRDLATKLKGFMHDITHIGSVPGKTLPDKVALACRRNDATRPLGTALLVIMGMVFSGLVGAYIFKKTSTTKQIQTATQLAGGLKNSPWMQKPPIAKFF